MRQQHVAPTRERGVKQLVNISRETATAKERVIEYHDELLVAVFTALFLAQFDHRLTPMATCFRRIRGENHNLMIIGVTR